MSSECLVEIVWDLAELLEVEESWGLILAVKTIV
jgi:hypothetical protein